jgi:hypothetical protein
LRYLYAEILNGISVRKEKNFYKILGNLNNYFRVAKFKRKFNIEKPMYLLDVFIGQSCFVQELL